MPASASAWPGPTPRRPQAARNAWLHAAEQRLLNAHAVIPLYFYTSKHLVSAQVQGFEANALDRHASRWMRVETRTMKSWSNHGYRPAAPGIVVPGQKPGSIPNLHGCSESDNTKHQMESQLEPG